MSMIFMTISIIFHILSFLLIFILFKRIQSKKNENLSQTRKILEETLAQLKVENDRLRKGLVTQSTENKRHTKRTKDTTKQMKKVSDSQQFKQLLENKIRNITDDQNPDEYKLSFQGKVLQLYDQGYSIDDIAQRLNCGKTEVDLVIRFQNE